MDDDFDRCYRAISSRDSRFDGRFVTAVTSTGIYCRPSCPAQTPRRENVRFFRRAAAAAAAGFRACRRCRPDAAPGTRDWDARADLAARALRGIESGIVDRDGVPGLARRLAVSERHLHRTLVREVGVGPLALARTRRAQTARMLIEHTPLPLTSVAFAAGFASVRQFNDVMRAEFGAPPGDLRRGAAGVTTDAGSLTIRLALRKPYDPAAILGWLGGRAIQGVETVDATTYRRTVADGIVELTPNAEAGHLVASVQLDDVAAIGRVVAQIRRLFDLDADPTSVDTTLAADQALAASVVRHPGIRVPGTVDGFELAVRAVLGQQVSVGAARTFAGRLALLCGEAVTDDVLTRRFPTAAAVAAADLSVVGLTSARAATLRALAEAVASGELVLDPAADRDEVAARLSAIRGIGPWTVDYIAMRALGDPDAFPASDLVLRRAVAVLGGADRPERWRPWRAYAAMHLWTAAAEENQP